MTDEERERFAAEWREKYPCPLEEIEVFCSPGAIAEFRAEEAVRECAERFRDRVSGSVTEAKDSLFEHLRGSKRNDSVESRLQKLHHTGPDRRNEVVDDFKQALRLIDKFLEDFEDVMGPLVDYTQEDAPYFPAPGVIGPKRTDTSCGRAIYDVVSAQIHGTRFGVRVDWTDVRRALEWLGHDITRRDTKDLQDAHERYRAAEHFRTTGEKRQRRKPRI